MIAFVLLLCYSRVFFVVWPLGSLQGKNKGLIVDLFYYFVYFLISGFDLHKFTGRRWRLDEIISI